MIVRSARPQNDESFLAAIDKDYEHRCSSRTRKTAAFTAALRQPVEQLAIDHLRPFRSVSSDLPEARCT